MIKKIFGFLLETVQQVVFALAIFMLIYFFFMQPHQVKGHSMDPNFDDGEYILTDKISYRFDRPKRGDVIIFAAPPARREDYIKRIIAVPGETIWVSDGKVFINGDVLQENYLPTNTRTFGNNFLSEGEKLTLNENEYFVLGDNRVHSSDSRFFGEITKSDIVGRAWIVYWPISKIKLLGGVSYAGI